MTKYLSAAVAALFLTSTASAGIYTGNPSVVFQIDRKNQDLIAAVADVNRVRIHACDGGHQDYIIDDTYDFVKGMTVVINGGDLCYAEVIWDSKVVITGNTFTAISSQYSSMIDIDPITPTDLENVSVVSGNMPDPSNEPFIYVTIQ